MLYKVARKLTTTYLDTLSFADRTGGLVRVMHDHRVAEKTYPMEVNQDKVVHDEQTMRRLVPNSDLTSVMYWEQGGSPTIVEDHNEWYGVEATLKLVCWYNYQLVDPDLYDPAYLVAEVISAIPFSIGSFECLAAVTCAFAGQDPNDGSAFSDYTYNEPETQFFKYPYDYFVLNFDVSYRVVRNCDEEGLSDVPVTPILIYMSGNADKVIGTGGVSGRKAQIEIYAVDLTVLTSKALYEFSGEPQTYTVTPKVGVNTIFKLDYGQTYLRRIDVSGYGVYRIDIPAKPLTAEECLRYEYVDLSDNAIVTESYFTLLIDYIYFSDVQGGTLDISGGTNAAITNVVSLAQLADMVATRGWTVTNN